jgi:hypothetical protein
MVLPFDIRLWQSLGEREIWEVEEYAGHVRFIFQNVRPIITIGMWLKEIAASKRPFLIHFDPPQQPLSQADFFIWETGRSTLRHYILEMFNSGNFNQSSTYLELIKVHNEILAMTVKQ